MLFEGALYPEIDLIGWMYEASSEKTILRNCLQSLDMDKLAKEAGWSSKSRKVCALNWCMSLCLASAHKAPSLRIAAHFIGLVDELTVSRQAMHKRLLKGGSKLLEKALEAAIATKAHCRRGGRLGGFDRVLIQDSTSLKLPEALKKAYPGSSNQCGSTAIMKVQAVYGMLGNRFEAFTLSAFTRNDQAAALDILEVAAAGDLILRDLGYFTLDSLKRIAAKGAWFLSRLKGGVNLYDPGTGEEIDLNAALRCRGKVDMQVFVGEKSRLPARLAAIKLSEEVANARRRKAKGNRDRRTNPGKGALELLGWQIMLTNCDGELLPIGQAREIYAMRWRIETIFKGWKSGLGIDEFAPSGSARMAEAIVQAALLRATLIHAVVIPWLQARDPSRRVSVVKLMDLIAMSSSFISQDAKANENVLENLSKHCRYDKRKRKNTLEKWVLLVSQMEELN